ncbi:MAG: hypothetical protein ACRDAP_05640 [Shewanella sp.]
MAAPAGNTGGAGAPPIAAAGAVGGPPDPRRARPDGQPMTQFLIEIGNEHPPADQDVGRRYVQDEEAQIQQALLLGDITQIGTTDTHQPGPEEGPEWGGNYPIYQFVGPQNTSQGLDEVKFTLDPRFKGVEAEIVPRIEHHIGAIHHGMYTALWAAYCYDNGQAAYTEENYEALEHGIMWRYAGEGVEPKFVPDSDSDDESSSSSSSDSD